MKKIIVFILFFFLFLGVGKAQCIYYASNPYLKVTISNWSSNSLAFHVYNSGTLNGGIAYFKEVVGANSLKTHIDDFNQLFLSESALKSIKSGICPDTAFYEYKWANSLCIQNKSDGEYCTKIDKEFYKVSDLDANEVTSMDCNYQGSKPDYRISIEKTPSGPSDVSWWYHSGTSRFSTADIKEYQKSGGQEVYLSKSALENAKANVCPSEAYFDENGSLDMCFQEKKDGNFCASKLKNAILLPMESNIVETYPYSTGITPLPGSETPGTTPETPGTTPSIPVVTPGPLLDLGANFCSHSGTLKTFKIIGICVIILKILIPIILIVVGSLELGKAVLASDDKAISLAITALTKKVLAAIIIFFIPTIIKFAFSLVSNFSSTVENFTDCTVCMNDIEECNKLIKNAK